MNPPSPNAALPEQTSRPWKNFALQARTRPVLTSLGIALFAWVLTTFLAAPPIWLIKEGRFPEGRDVDFLALCRNPLERNLAEPSLGYRLTTPLLAHALHLPGLWPLALQYLALVGLYTVVFLAVRRRAGEIAAAWSMLLVALSFTTFWTNTHDGMPDSVTHLLVATCLLSAHPAILLAAAFLGTFNDERFIIAVPFILLWHAPSSREDWKPFLRTHGENLLRTGGALALGILLLLPVRHALQVGWVGPGITPHAYDTDFSGPQRWVQRLLSRSYPCNVLVSWRWAWWLPVAGLMQRAVPWWQRGIYLLCLAAGCLMAGKVGDVSRSIGFLFPAFLLAVIWLWENGQPRLERKLGLTVLACVLTPVFHLVDNGAVHWMRPLPVALWRYVKATPPAGLPPLRQP